MLLAAGMHPKVALVLVVGHHSLNGLKVGAVAVILTALEIGSPHGFDNLTIPIGGGWLVSVLL